MAQCIDRGRRLQQSSQLPTGGQCGLQFSNKSLNYSRCQSLTPLLGAGVDYNLLWTYQSRQPGMLMLALDAAVPANGYIGFGIPTTPDTMIGASAIVVKANSSAPTGTINPVCTSTFSHRTRPLKGCSAHSICGRGIPGGLVQSR